VESQKFRINNQFKQGLIQESEINALIEQVESPLREWDEFDAEKKCEDKTHR
jgi:hypothetical protein